jgi:hypothetical protein
MRFADHPAVHYRVYPRHPHNLLGMTGTGARKRPERLLENQSESVLEIKPESMLAITWYAHCLGPPVPGI